MVPALRVLPPLVLATLLGACGDGRSPSPGGPTDSGTPPAQRDAGSDAGSDAGVTDAGSVDAGPTDAGSDGGGMDGGQDAGGSDAGPGDGGTDAGASDGGTDAGADAGAADAGFDAGIVYVDPGPGQCRGTWCWEYPRPQGNSLTDVWVSPSETWAVGAGGLALRWDGARWHITETGSRATLTGVWGSSPQDVWAVGFGRTMLRWDGSQWRSVADAAVAPQLDLRSVSGSGPNDVHIVGDGFWNSRWRSGAYRWDGSTWTSTYFTSYMNFSDINAIRPDNQWIVGRSSVYHSTDGGGWASQESAPEELNAVWSWDPEHVWVASDNHVYQRDPDGGTWLEQTTLPGTQNYASSFQDLWGSGPGDVWAAASPAPGYSGLHHWNGQAWRALPAGMDMTLLGVSGNSAADVWTVGSGGLVLRYDGTAWNQLSDPRVGALYASAGSPEDFWMAGAGGTLMRWDGTRWTRHFAGTSVNLIGLWAGSPQDVWAAGGSGTLLHWDGTRWSSVPSGVTAALRGVWGSRSDDVWAVGDSGVILHWDGGAWSQVSITGLGTLTDVWGSSASDVWAVGTGATVAHYDGAAWTRVNLGGLDFDYGTSFAAVQGSSATDVWVVANEGKVLHFNGSTWRIQSDFDGLDARSNGERSDTITHNVDVVVRGPGDVWVLSQSAMNRNVSRWNGSSWTWEAGLSTGRYTTFARRGTDLVFGDGAGGITRRP